MEDNVKKNAGEEDSVQKKHTTPGGNLLAYLHDLVWLLTAIILIFLLGFRAVIVSGPSMENTLVDGDYLLLVGNLLYRNPEQGDIVVAAKDSFRGGEPIVKRVIATEGQTVDIDFIRGTVSVDGTVLEEPYIKNLTHMQEGVEFPLTVAEGCIFVMGDNRGDSKDSRSPEIGLIDTREILGKAIFLFLPGTAKGTQPRDFARIGVLS